MRFRDRGQISSAHLAWQYNRDGLTSVDASDGPVVPQLVGEVGTAEAATEIDRFGNVQLPPGSHVRGCRVLDYATANLEAASLIVELTNLA